MTASHEWICSRCATDREVLGMRGRYGGERCPRCYNPGSGMCYVEIPVKAPAVRNWPIGRYPLAEAMEKAIEDSRSYRVESLWYRQGFRRPYLAMYVDYLDRQRVELGIPSAVYW